MNLNVSVSAAASGELARTLADAQEYTVVTWGEQGAFPATATVYVRADGLADGQTLKVYMFDQSTGRLTKLDNDARVVSGYAEFSLDEGGTYVLSEDDLALSGSAEGTDSTTTDIAEVNTTTARSGAGWAIAVAAALVVAAAVIVLLVRRHSRKAAQPVEPDVVEDGKATGAQEADETANDDNAASAGR